MSNLLAVRKYRKTDKYIQKRADRNAQQKEWALNNPDKIRATRALNRASATRIAVTRSRSAKAFFIAMKGGKCVDCGTSSIHPAAYDFDHRDPATKSFEISKIISSKPKSLEALLELEKCDLVCANCHRARTAKY